MDKPTPPKTITTRMLGTGPAVEFVLLTDAIAHGEAMAAWGAAQERERCAHICKGIGAGHAGRARALDGQHAAHAAGQRDGANECAAAIRSAQQGD